MIWKYILLFHRLPFHFVDDVLCCAHKFLSDSLHLSFLLVNFILFLCLLDYPSLTQNCSSDLYLKTVLNGFQILTTENCWSMPLYFFFPPFKYTILYILNYSRHQLARVPGSIHIFVNSVNSHTNWTNITFSIENLGSRNKSGEDWGQEEKGTTKDKMVGWHHWLNGHEFEPAPGVGDGQGTLACCSLWACKELDMTERLNWADLRDKAMNSIDKVS